jgi:hypothetical protein
MPAGHGIIQISRHIAASPTYIEGLVLSDYKAIGEDICTNSPITLSVVVAADTLPDPSVGRVFLTVSHGKDEPFALGPLTPSDGVASITIDNPSLYFTDGYGAPYSVVASYTGAGGYDSSTSRSSPPLDLVPRFHISAEKNDHNSMRELVPVISSVSPPFGSVSGGTNITLHGHHFTGTTSVSIGEIDITSLTVVDDNTITGTTAAGSVSNADIVVKTATKTGSGTLLAGFTYLPASWTLGLSADLGITTSSGNTITGWADQSKGGNHFTAGNAGPTYTSGSPSFMTFDGQTTSLSSKSPASSMFAANGSQLSLYVVALPSSAKPGSTADWDGFFVDAAFGYYDFGITSSSPSNGSNSPVCSIFGGGYFTSDAKGGIDYTNITLSTYTLSSGGLTVRTNSGNTFSGNTATMIGIGNVGASPSIGTSQTGNFYNGKLYAVFCFNTALSTHDDGVVKTMFKNLYSIPNW